MESQLFDWIQNKARKGHFLCTDHIIRKALSLYKSIKMNNSENSDARFAQSFTASSGWFHGFKSRYDVTHLLSSSENTCADGDSVAAFQAQFKAIVQEGGYSSKQIFNVAEIKLFWRRLPKKVCCSDEETSAQEDKVSVVLCGNANGDCKLKLMLVMSSEEEKVLKSDKSELPVSLYSNLNASLTQTFFTDWFTSSFFPVVALYNQEQNLDNKALFVVDSANFISPDLRNAFPHIRIVFLPPNTAASLQPMDQGIADTFKTFYLKELFKNFVDASAGKQESTIARWKQYNMDLAVFNFANAWRAVPGTVMEKAWKKLRPNYPSNTNPQEDELADCYNDLVRLSKLSGFGELSISDIAEVLNDRNGDSTARESLPNTSPSDSDDNLPGDNLDRPCSTAEDDVRSADSAGEDNVESACSENSSSTAKRKYDLKSEFFKTAQRLTDLAEQINPNKLRLASFQTGINELMSPYKDMAEEPALTLSLTSPGRVQ